MCSELETSESDVEFALIDRPRLIAALDALFDQHQAVVTVASPGSGTTVLARQFTRHRGLETRWLDLTESDSDPARLVAHLVAELADDTASNTADLETHPDLIEAAATTAESLSGPLLIVFDRLEHIAKSEESSAALATFVEYVPADIQLLLVTHEDLGGPFARLALKDQIGRLVEDDLVMDLDEIEELLARGTRALDPVEVLRVTDGWIAAVATIARVTEDELDAALDVLVEDRIHRHLSEEEWGMLVTGSVSPHLDAGLLAALRGEEGLPIFERLRSRHLPMRRSPSGNLMFPPVLRAALQRVLHKKSPGKAASLQRTYARHLFREGRFTEATEEFLRSSNLDDAARSAEPAVRDLLEGAEWSTLGRWLRELGDSRVEASPILQGALIRFLYATREFVRARDVVRRLTAEGTMNEIVAADPSVVAYLGLVHHWEPRQAITILNRHPGDFRAEALWYELHVLTSDQPATPPTGVEWSDMERIMSWGLLLQGRLDQLLEMLPKPKHGQRQRIGRTPHPLLGLICRGEQELARDLLDQVSDRRWGGAHTDLWHFYDAWLRWAADDPTASLASAEVAIELTRASRSGAESCFQVVQACALIEMGSVDTARSVLERSIDHSVDHGLVAYVEWAQMLLGLVELAESRPSEAVVVLSQAVSSMRRAERRLFLPMAGVYLSEALALVGQFDEARHAAELAYDEAHRVGNWFPLERAVRHAPGVLVRQLELDAHSRWRRLLNPRTPNDTARVLVPPANSRKVFVEVKTFGDEPDIIVDGRQTGLRRIKVLELATLLALHPQGIDRADLQSRLFPLTDQRRGGNYYRQVVHKLRQVTGIGLERGDDGLVRWANGVQVVTTDGRIESLLAQAMDLTGADRLDTLCAALTLFTGTFLAGSELDWAEARRAELEIKRSAVSLDAGQLALELGDAARARGIALGAISADPYLEPAYQILMTAEARTGSTNVLGVYQRLVAALDQLGVRPDPRSEALLEELRS